MKKCIVWFSGWIDSTFVAWYLKQSWYEVLLIFLKNIDRVDNKKLYELSNYNSTEKKNM